MLVFQDCVWGVAYEIPNDVTTETKQHLDHREKGGYESQSVTFHPQDDGIEPFMLDIYVGSKENPFFLGPTSLDEMAEQIAFAVGPSGTNREYIYELASAMRTLAPQIQDHHLYELEASVKAVCKANQIEAINKVEIT